MNIEHFHDPKDGGRVHEALERDGVAVIDALVPGTKMRAVEQELSAWLAAPDDQSPLGNNTFTGMATYRTSGLIRKSESCRELVMNALVLDVVDRVLGPQCARFQLTFTQAIRIGPGEVAQVAHQDTAMYPFARPGPEVFVNAIWAAGDFTADNGATRFYPGSHRWPGDRTPQSSDRTVAAEMACGSVVIYYGSCWHFGGANITALPRTGIAFGYTLGWLRQEENQYLAVPIELARTLPHDLQRLLGYAEHQPFLGWYEGQDHDVFRGGSSRNEYATELIGGRAKTVRRIMSDGVVSRERS